MAGLNIVVSTWLALDISKFSWAALSATVISRSRTGTQTLPLEASALLEENSKSFCSICWCYLFLVAAAFLADREREAAERLAAAL